MHDMEIIDPAISLALQNAVHGDTFGALLLAAAQKIARVEEVYGFWQQDGASPESFASSSELGDAENRVHLYATQYHHFDPVSFERGKTAKGQGAAVAISASDIALEEYRHACFERPALKTKYFFGWHADDGWFVVNFYARAFNDRAALARLGQLAAFGLSAMMVRISPAPDEQAFVLTLESRLAAIAPALTVRERQVCARTLAGMEAPGIEKALGIGQNSVRTYRQRAYQKYGISSANQFLQFILSNRVIR